METDVKEALDGLGRAFEEFKATNDARLAELGKKGAADVDDDFLATIEGWRKALALNLALDGMAK